MPSVMRPDRTAITIVTHKRQRALAKALHGWVSSLPEYRTIYIIANHPESIAGVVLPSACQVIQTGRPLGHCGNLGQSWNLGWLWAFSDPAIEWVVCSQDDVEIRPGWLELVQQHPADLYLAPSGDNIFLLSREGFRKIGWFDELFTVTGYHEWDWTARAILALGEAVHIEDGHGWSYNPIGLRRMWRQDQDGYARDFLGYMHTNVSRLVEKWGMTPEDFQMALEQHRVPKPRVPEIDWYPWFKR